MPPILLSPPTMLTIDTTLRAFLVASWFNSLLYMAEVYQVAHYFSTRGNDRLALKLAVGVSIVVDTVCTLVDYVLVYLLLITDYGTPPLSKPWPVPVITFTTGVSGTIMQSFLLYRFWRLTRRLTITLGIAIAIFIAFGGYIATTIYRARNPSFEPGKVEDISVTIALAFSAFTDIAVAAALIWKLRSMSLLSIKSTRQTIRRIILTVFQTGVAPCTVTVIILFLRFTVNGCEIGRAIGTCLGRVYSITMIYNLNCRPIRADSSGMNTTKDLTDSFNPTSNHVYSIFIPADQYPGKTFVFAESIPPQNIGTAGFKRGRRVNSI